MEFILIENRFYHDVILFFKKINLIDWNKEETALQKKEYTIDEWLISVIKRWVINNKRKSMTQTLTIEWAENPNLIWNPNLIRGNQN